MSVRLGDSVERLGDILEGVAEFLGWLCKFPRRLIGLISLPKGAREKNLPSSRAMENVEMRSKAVSALGVSALGLGGLASVVGILVTGWALHAVTFVSRQPPASVMGRDLLLLAGAASLIVSLCSVALGLPLALAGYGVLKRRRWGRFLMLGVGALYGLIAIISGSYDIDLYIVLGPCAVAIFSVLLNRRYIGEFNRLPAASSPDCHTCGDSLAKTKRHGDDAASLRHAAQNKDKCHGQ